MYKKISDFGSIRKVVLTCNVHVQLYTGVVLDDESVSLLCSHMLTEPCRFILHSTHRYMHTPAMQTAMRTVRAERTIMRM